MRPRSIALYLSITFSVTLDGCALRRSSVEPDEHLEMAHARRHWARVTTWRL